MNFTHSKASHQQRQASPKTALGLDWILKFHLIKLLRHFSRKATKDHFTKRYDKMDEDGNPNREANTKETVRFWRAWKTVHEMCLDRVHQNRETGECDDQLLIVCLLGI